eukprot:2939340-Rhodomonas_salina.3
MIAVVGQRRTQRVSQSMPKRGIAGVVICAGCVLLVLFCLKQRVDDGRRTWRSRKGLAAGG